MKMLSTNLRVEHVNIYVYIFVYVFIYIYIYIGVLVEYISQNVAAYGQFVLVVHRLIRFCRSFINYNKNNNKTAFQYCFDYITMTV